MVFFILFLLAAPSAVPASSGDNAVPVLFPGNMTIVGTRVNVVLDPFEPPPFFQVLLNGDGQAVVNTSSGIHGQQGLPLRPGKNVITVHALMLMPGKDKTSSYAVSASRVITVFNRTGSYAPVPASFREDPFHSDERESKCEDCHRLAVNPEDRKPQKAEEVLCLSCHRDIRNGEHQHGPAALGFCLSCHDSGVKTAKYSFSANAFRDITKTVPAVEPMFNAAESAEKKSKEPTVAETCLKCHASILNKSIGHGPVAGGYCSICHDAHAGGNPAWLRKPVDKLCTGCHGKFLKESHVLSGMSKRGHPTRAKKDPSRPGKPLTCASCHEPHSADSTYLFAFGVTDRDKLCEKCHAQ